MLLISILCLLAALSVQTAAYAGRRHFPVPLARQIGVILCGCAAFCLLYALLPALDSLLSMRLESSALSVYLFFLLFALLWLLLGFLCSLLGKALASLSGPAKSLSRFWNYFLAPFAPRTGEKETEEAENPETDKPAESSFPTGSEVMKNVLELNDTAIDEICTHRSDMITLSTRDDSARWNQIIMDNRHTFYPIIGENGDDIIGILDTRDYFRLPGVNRKKVLEKTVDPPFFISENTTAYELLRQMKQKKNYFSVVLDEYGGVTGIVTLHDIVEELFGDMPDADQASKGSPIVRLPKGVWRISGEAHLEDVSRELGMPLELDEFETFSGYILGSLGYIPEDGTQFEARIGRLDIQIKKIENHRIRQTLVKLIPEAQKENSNEQAASGN